MSFPDSEDKKDNPICALPGTPGIGKSSFLRHLPYTEQYENYLRKHFPVNPLPIVVPVTFNSVMEDHRTADSFPARMLYGAATELFLGLGIPKAMTWSNFYGFHEKHRRWCERGPSAIKLLLETFGDRPLILLVDEVSKLDETEGDVKKVMHQVGVILSDFGNCDVVLSSLSPMFIKDLLTGSQRKIIYTLLPTLPDKSPVVRKLASSLVSVLKKDKAIAAAALMNKARFSMNLLENLPLLLNDYPRQLERLFVNNIESIQEDVKKIAKKHLPGGSTMALLHALKDRLLKDALQDISVFTPVGNDDKEKVLSFALKRYAYDVRASGEATLRKFFELPYLYMEEDPSTKGNYFPTLPLLQLLQIANDTSSSGHLGKQLRRAFGTFDSASNFSTLFERAVLLKIASTEIDSETNSRELFGVDLPIETSLNVHAHANLKIPKSKEDFNELFKVANASSKSEMSVIASFGEEPGIDGVAVLSFLKVYLQMKCSRDRKTKIEHIRKVLAIAVHNALKFHCNASGLAGAELDKLSDIHVVFYEWHENDRDFRKAEVINMFKEWVENQRKSREEELEAQRGNITLGAACYEALVVKNDAERVAENRTLEFLETRFESNVHVLGKKEMSQWMPPTLLSIAQLTEAVTEGKEEQEPPPTKRKIPPTPHQKRSSHRRSRST